MQALLQYSLYHAKCVDEESLFAKKLEYLNTLGPWLLSYIWNKDSFHIFTKQSTNDGFYLSGSMDVEENVEDEWFVVFLLLQLSKLDPDLFIQVWDEDGQFILLESEHPPKWLFRSTSPENRVWIHQNALHIIPPSVCSMKKRTLSIRDAIRLVTTHLQETHAPADIQDAILHRIQGYPGEITKQQHHVNITLPYSAAVLLQMKPNLVAPLVHHFHRTKHTFSRIPTLKHFPPENMVTVNTTFTRFLYAKLMCSPFHPPKRCGWPTPTPGNWRQKKTLDTGVKLTYALESLLRLSQLSNGVDGDLASGAVSSRTLDETNAQWKKFLESLTNSNYFMGELAGSKRHMQLLNEAKAFYLRNFDQVSFGTSQITLIGSEIRQALSVSSKEATSLSELKEREKSLPADDDESWMYISASDLDVMLEKKCNVPTNKSTASADKGDDDLEKAIETFLNQSAPLEGLESDEDSEGGDISSSSDESVEREGKWDSVNWQRLQQSILEDLTFSLPKGKSSAPSTSRAAAHQKKKASHSSSGGHLKKATLCTFDEAEDDDLDLDEYASVDADLSLGQDSDSSASEDVGSGAEGKLDPGDLSRHVAEANKDELWELTRRKRGRARREQMKQVRDRLLQMKMEEELIKSDVLRGMPVVSPKPRKAVLASTEDFDSDDSFGDEEETAGDKASGGNENQRRQHVNQYMMTGLAAEQGRIGPSAALLHSVGIQDLHVKAAVVRSNANEKK